MAHEPLKLFVSPILCCSQVVDRSVLETKQQFVLQRYPRKLRELHIVLPQYLQCLLSEHHLLRQGHIRYHRGLFLAHTAASDGYDGKIVYESAIARFKAAKFRHRNLFSPHVEQRPRRNEQYPPRKTCEDHLQIDEQLAYLRIQPGKVV